ncbi:hypothetical protein BU23DRAFT_557144 [Bimuria novae-zelandiae CBS 107.79]|uniref:Rhodopsin domain-containing protein n=1 Tax=Bimuria novae-zelandiae CBS 107.79 TaxID=1447943 RepID=A0A6A5UYS6_9PLEO|nr:hypothetical protein BU23DRAFT_557144 [Bimuria novae-zelandiae CBS 107.79]
MVALNQDYSKGLMIGLGVVFMIVPAVFVGLRVFAKHLGRRKSALEDYLCFAALAIAITCSILQIVAAVHGRLGQHQKIDANGQPILDDPEFLVYERTKFAVNILSVVGLGFIKASILIFYRTIFTTKTFRWAVYVMLGIVGGWTIAYAFSNLFTCYPITPLVEPFYGNKCMSGAIDMWLSVVYTDLIIDVLILLMPIPMVLRLQLPWAQKLGVLGMFLLGSTVCAVSVTRLLLLIQISQEFAFHYNDETYYTSPVFFWMNIELSLAVISGCLPTLRPIWTYLHPKQPSSHYLGNIDYELGNSGKRSELYTELDDADQPVLGVETSIQAVESPPETVSNGVRHSGSADGLKGGISIHTSVETRSVHHVF